ncbi:hypothetical protein AC244_33835 [Ensifer adhaerens]|uniref:Uncharacterized protein n=1 Tax=Ensifer adhaerens TaxID=106592 RepID=A0A0L8BD99_ENSAD|nr:hypothetical protein AC244_33835 [Ensifer adhaerens]
MSALLEPRSDKHPALPIGQFFHDPHQAPHPVLVLKLFFRPWLSSGADPRGCADQVSSFHHGDWHGLS